MLAGFLLHAKNKTPRTGSLFRPLMRGAVVLYVR